MAQGKGIRTVQTQVKSPPKQLSPKQTTFKTLPPPKIISKTKSKVSPLPSIIYTSKKPSPIVITSLDYSKLSQAGQKTARDAIQKGSLKLVTSTPQTKVPQYLSKSTIAAQQDLSNKYGIATFSTKGAISTVPTIESGGFSDIFVGTGKYRTFDEFAKAAIDKQIQDNNLKSAGGINVTDTGLIRPAEDNFVVSDPSSPARFFNPESKQGSPIFQDQPFEQGQSGSTLSGLMDFLKKNAVYLVLGVALLVVLSGFRGGKGRR